MTKNRTTTIPSETTSVKSENYTKNILQTGSNAVTMEASKSPAKESSDKAKAATHDALVYRRWAWHHLSQQDHAASQ